MDKCPKCGGTSGFFYNEKVSGYIEKLSEWDGKIYNTNFDKLKYHYPDRPKTGVCADCGKRIKTEGISE